MPLLKNLMQASALNIRKAYKRSASALPRIASFIGTSNREDLLVDRTGSRRFLCVSNCTPSSKRNYCPVNAAGSTRKKSRLSSSTTPCSTNIYPKKRCSASVSALPPKRTIRRKC